MLDVQRGHVAGHRGQLIAGDRPDDLGQHLDSLSLQRRHAGVDHYLFAPARLGFVLDSNEHWLDSAHVFLHVGEEAAVRLGLRPADLPDRHVGHGNERPASAAKRIVGFILGKHDLAAVGARPETWRQELARD